MSCQDYFSIHALSNSSLSNEIFSTSECINNKLKLACFTINIIVYFTAMIYSIYLFRKSQSLSSSLSSPPSSTFKSKLSVKSYICLLVIFGSICNVITNVIYIIGVINSIRNLIFSGALSSLVLSITLLLRSWLKVTITVNCKICAIIDILLVGLNISIFVSNLVCVKIGMIVYQHDQNIVNWLYVINVSTNMLFLTIFSVILLIICDRFLNAIVPCIELDSNDLSLTHMSNKLRFLVKIVKFNLPIITIMIFIPLWMLIDLKGIFYYHFSVIQIFYIMGYMCQFMFIINDDDKIETSSSFNSNSNSDGINMDQRYTGRKLSFVTYS
jgi:hypothetical protein